MGVLSKELKLHQDSELRFCFTTTVDDSNLSDPHAYDHMGRTYRRFNRKVTIRNTCNIPFFELRITTNNEDLSSFENLKTYLQLGSNDTASVFKIYNLWKDHVFHASSCLRANDNPYCLLNFWGHSICSETAHALAILLSNLGVRWRRVDLNGHCVIASLSCGIKYLLSPMQIPHLQNS